MIYQIKKILAAVDMSEPSLNALNVAVSLAKNNNATLHVVNVIEPEFLNKPIGDSQNVLRLENFETLTAFIKAIKRMTGMSSTLSIEQGVPYQIILETADADSYDLIVTGKNGISGCRTGFMGTTAYNIIKYSSRPVLTVPPPFKKNRFLHILYPARATKEILQRFGMTLPFTFSETILDILVLDFQNRIFPDEELRDLVNEKISIAPSIQYNLERTQINEIGEDEIIRLAALQNESDLLVLTSEIDSVTRYNYISSTLQRLMHFTDLPVLSVKRPGSPIFS